jgi:hypothetical protein
MHVLKMLALYRKFSKLYRLLEEAKMKKKLWRSKTFWFQVLSVAAAVSGAIPLPADITAAIVGVINVGLRLVTTEGVGV